MSYQDVNPPCECVHDCRSCSRTGSWHVHASEGPCEVHPDAEVS